MREVPLAELVEPATAGFWGEPPGSSEIDVRVIRNGDVQAGGTLRWSEIPLRGYTARERSKAEVRIGDLVLTTSGNCGHIAYIDRTTPEPLCASNFLRILRPRTSVVDPRYLFHLLNSDRFRHMLAPYIRGSTLQNLSYTRAAEAVRLPLPPLDKQRRIAAILDKTDELRAKRCTSLERFSSIAESLFLEVLSENPNIPSVSIKSLADHKPGAIRTGPFGSQLLHSEFVQEGVRVLGIDNVVANEFRWAEPRHITYEKYESLRRFTVHPGDVLVTIMGTCGRAAVVPDNVPLAISTKHLCCITVDREVADPRWVHAALLYDRKTRQQLGERAKGAVMPGLNMGLIRATAVPLPTLAVQQQFVTRLEAVERLKANLSHNATELDALFMTVQSRAFRGEL